MTQLDGDRKGREGKGRDGMGWDGMGWDGMGWDGMGWDGMGWDGMGWDGMGWDGMGWDGMGWDGMGWDGMGWDGMGWDGMGWDGMGWDGMGWDVTGWQKMEREGMGWDRTKLDGGGAVFGHGMACLKVDGPPRELNGSHDAGVLGLAGDLVAAGCREVLRGAEAGAHDKLHAVAALSALRGRRDHRRRHVHRKLLLVAAEDELRELAKAAPARGS